MKEIKSRIKFLDIAKFIGIFCIYLGHFDFQAGNAGNFVFYFHVPLFFFLSGCSESLSRELSSKEYIIKSVKRILLPTLFFAFFSIFIICIIDNSYEYIIYSLRPILQGFIRNSFAAYSLWFLTCLFVVKIVFFFLKKFIKKTILILIISLGLFAVAEFVITPRPIIEPHMFFNIDSACYYMIFYVLGYYGYNLINKILMCDRFYKKFVVIVVGILSLIYTAFLFFDKNLLSFFHTIKVLNLFVSILTPIIIIILIILISKLLENVKVFSDIGENTLYLCGSEYIIKKLVPAFLQIMDIYIYLENPLSTYIYTFILLVLCNKILVPFEKIIFKKLNIIE